MAKQAGKAVKKPRPKKAASAPVLTGRTQKWMESVAASLERDTGKNLDQWVKIAKTCPETTPKRRAAWLKQKHDLGVNRAAQIFSVAFPSGPSWDQPDELLDQLWKDANGRAIYDAVVKMVRAEFPQAIVGPRKTFVSFSGKIQFAAIIPASGGKAEMGFPLPLSASKRLAPMKKRPWAEKHTGMLVLSAPKEVDTEVKRLLRLSWEKVA